MFSSKIELYLHFMRLSCCHCSSDATKFVIQLELSRKNDIKLELSLVRAVVKPLMYFLFPYCRSFGSCLRYLSLSLPLTHSACIAVSSLF